MKRLAVIVNVMFFVAPHITAQLVDHHAEVVSLPSALLSLTKTRHISIVAEVVEPIPTATVNVSQTWSADRAVNYIVSQCPGYVWEKENAVYIIRNKDLLKSKRSPLDVVVHDYKSPGNFADFKASFPSVVEAALEQRMGAGGFMSGLRLPDDSEILLPRHNFQKLKASDILVVIAQDVGTLYSLSIIQIVKPKGSFKISDWKLAAGKELKSLQLYDIGGP